MSNLLDGLNAPQTDAVMSRSKSILVLAGAGSGKTSVLTKRIAYLIQERGVSASNVLALTFTRRAAREMKDRLERLLGKEAKQIWTNTFHSASLRILEEFGSKIGYYSGISVYDEVDQLDVVESIIRELGVKKLKGKDVTADLARFASNCDIHEFEEPVASIVMEYRRRLKSFNAIDFTLLLTETLQLIRTVPEVFNYYHEKFKFIFLDEYQDVDRTQYTLHEAIKPDNIFAVGDFQQAIYSWRGSDINIILDYEKDHPGAEVIKLEQSFRCPKNVITAANNLISHNPQKWEMKLWTNNPAQTTNEVHCASPLTEAKLIASAITMFSLGFSPKDFAILTRTHSQHEPIAYELEQAKIPYTLVGRELGYWKRTAPRMIVSILLFLHNRRDAYQFRKIVRDVIFGLTQTQWLELEVAAMKAERRMIDFVIEQNPGHLNDLVKWYDAFEGKPTLWDVVQEIIKQVDLHRYFQERDLYHKDFELEQIGAHVAEWENQNEDDKSVEAFLSFLAEQDIQSEVSNEDTVKVATIHAVKGLEFPVVFVAGMNEGRLPHDRSVKQGTVEEERRLCYVAVTRAKRCLFLSSSKTDFRGKQLIESEKSRFIEELTNPHSPPHKE